MRKLSVIIPTFNEEDNILEVLNTVRWANEWIVVDNFSADRTAELAKTFGATVYERKYTGPADQKNWAIPQATHEWILLLDADERVTPELALEIRHWLEQQTEIPYDAFWIGRQNHFMGRKIRFSGWQNDAVVRLIRRDVCRYDNKQVHEEIDTAHIQVSRLKAKMDHFTFKSLDHFLEKMQRYARWSAQDHAGKTKAIGLYHLCLKPLFRFFKHYILKGGILDGATGFIISVIMAWGVFLRYAYLLAERRSGD